jgi:hypothetical protein
LRLHGDYIWRIFLDMGPDAEHLSKILRRLTPRQEKVVRLHLGLGCKHPHSVGEMAAEFGVSTTLITAILDAATKRLAESGVTIGDLKKTAREPTVALRTNSRHRRRRPE